MVQEKRIVAAATYKKITTSGSIENVVATGLADIDRIVTEPGKNERVRRDRGDVEIVGTEIDKLPLQSVPRTRVRRPSFFRNFGLSYCHIQRNCQMAQAKEERSSVSSQAHSWW
jgi:hypothetical protein